MVTYLTNFELRTMLEKHFDELPIEFYVEGLGCFTFNQLVIDDSGSFPRLSIELE